MTVTKSFTPNTEATPPAANTAAANGESAASPLATLKLPGKVTSSVYFMASGFGVGEGVAVAMARRRLVPGRPTLARVSVFFRSRPTRVDPEDLRRRLAAAVAERWPGADVEVHLDGGTPVIGWHDGPAATSMTALVAELVNWEVRGVAVPPARPGAPAVLLDRTLSDGALAVAVVRFAGSNVRPYDSGDPKAVETLGRLLDEDDPATSGYPGVDRRAELLLERRAPEAAGPGASRADHLAAALTALGYDALWRVAWAELT